MKTIEQNFLDWYEEAFGFGYGSGEPHVLSALLGFFLNCNDQKYNAEDIAANLGSTVSWLIIIALCRDGVIEYGSSSRSGWLSERGIKLREFMLSNEFGELLKILCEYPEDYVFCYRDRCNCQKFCSNPFWS